MHSRPRGGRRPRHRAAAALLVAVALAAAPAATARAQAPRPAADVFDELQRNVWYVPTADRRASLYVTAMGEGPPVVVLHGGPGNDFHYLVPALRPLRDRYRFVLFDQRGSLLSPVRPEHQAAVTFDQLVDDIEAVRTALGEERLVLLAHSFGTMVAQGYYRRYPDRVAGLVLVASAPPHADSTRPLGVYGGQVAARMKELRARPGVAAALAAAGVPADAAPAALSATQRAARRRIADLAAVNLARLERWPEMIGGGVYYNGAIDGAVGNSLAATFDTRPTIAAHGAPVTVVQGDQDFLDPAAAEWRGLARAGGPVRVEVLRDAGHYAWIDDPAGFAAAVERALARAARAPASPPAGIVDSFAVASAALGDTLPVHVYLPPGYSTARRHPVVYTAQRGVYFDRLRLPAWMDSAVARGAPPAIVVAVPDAGALEAFRPDTPAGDAYVRFIADELVPAVEARYAARAEPAGRLLLGFSVGANLFVDVAVRRPGRFGRVAAVSPGWMFRAERSSDIGAEFRAAAEANIARGAAPTGTEFWFVWGDGPSAWERRSREHGAVVTGALRARRARVTDAGLVPGDHGLALAQGALPAAMAFLLAPRG